MPYQKFALNSIAPMFMHIGLKSGTMLFWQLSSFLAMFLGWGLCFAFSASLAYRQNLDSLR